MIPRVLSPPQQNISLMEILYTTSNTAPSITPKGQESISVAN